MLLTVTTTVYSALDRALTRGADCVVTARSAPGGGGAA